MNQYVRRWLSDRHYTIPPLGLVGRRFARNTFWSLVGTVITNGLAVITSIITARLLGREGLGELGIVNSTVGMLGVFTGLGLGLAATKYVAELRVSDPVRAGRIIGLAMRIAAVSAGTISLVLFFAAPWLAANTLNAPHLSNELRLGCALLFIYTLNGVQAGALSGFEAYKTVAQIRLWGGLLQFPVMIISVWYFGLAGALVALIIVSTFSTWQNWMALRRESAKAGFAIAYDNARSELPILWTFLLPALLGGIVTNPFMWMASTVLANQPGGYADLGLVNVSNTWRNSLMLIPGIFASVALPILSSEQKNTTHFDKTLEISQSLAMSCILPVGSALILASDWILRLYGAEYMDGSPIFVLMIVGVAISGLGSATGSALQSLGKMWLGASMNLTWGIVYFLTTWFLVANLGGMALAIGFSLAYAILAIWGNVYLYRQGVVTRSLMYRMFGGSAYMIVIGTLSLVLPATVRLGITVPIIALSVWLSLWVWSAPPIRQRVWSILRAIAPGTPR